MTTNALERLREKKRSGQPLTPLESVVWDAFWTQDPDAFDAAEELERLKQLLERWNWLGATKPYIFEDGVQALKEQTAAALQAEAKP